MTARLPFDPNRMKTGKRAGPMGEQPVGPVSRADASITVSELAARIDSALKSGITGRIRVMGEVGNASFKTHWYFSLSDGTAVINAVVFRSTTTRAGHRPEVGERVVVTGRIDYYAPSGRVSLIVDKIEPAGGGDQSAELRRRVEMLRERGWLDPESKRSLPALPRAIAVVTSASGAALQDVIDTAGRRSPATRIVAIDARMQGELAETQVVEALRLIGDGSRLGVDAVLLTRGGGSSEDLAVFNSVAIATAIHELAIPVVAAIGHETDTTIAELVADERAATPTQAAMRLLPDRQALEEQRSALARRMRASIHQLLGVERRHLDMLGERPWVNDPSRFVARRREQLNGVAIGMRAVGRGVVQLAERRLAAVASRLERHRPATAQARHEERVRALAKRLQLGLQSRVRGAHDELDALHRELNAVGPMQVLSRGYSVTTTADGKAIRDAASVGLHEQLVTRVADGRIRSVVVKAEGEVAATKPASQGAGSGPPPRRSRHRSATDDRSQMDLF